MSQDGEKAVVLTQGEFTIRLVGFADPTPMIPQVMSVLQNMKQSRPDLGETNGLDDPALAQELGNKFAQHAQKLGQDENGYTLRPEILSPTSLKDVASAQGQDPQNEFDRISARAKTPVSKTDQPPEFVGTSDARLHLSPAHRKLRIIRDHGEEPAPQIMLAPEQSVANDAPQHDLVIAEKDGLSAAKPDASPFKTFRAPPEHTPESEPKEETAKTADVTSVKAMFADIEESANAIAQSAQLPQIDEPSEDEESVTQSFRRLSAETAGAEPSKRPAFRKLKI